MQNQSSYDKVSSCMIAPLNILFHTRLDDQVVEWMIEDLEGFSAEILKKSFKEIRNTCKRMPTLAQILEVCKKVAEENYVPTEKKLHEKSVVFLVGRAEDRHTDIAREILSTPAGKLALELGVAQSLLTLYEREGRKEFTIEWVKKQRRCLDEGIAEMESNRQRDAGLYKVLSSLLQGMLDREKELFQKFSVKIGQAV